MIDIVYKVVAFALTLGVLVVIHELGHFAIARLAGVKVLRFSVGFGRVLWSRRLGRDGTEWALSAIPLGGYVKMADEREGDVAAADLPRAFNRQSVGKRIAIVAAGPIANLLLAVVLFAGTFVAGVLLSVLNSFLNLQGVSPFYQWIVKGLILIGALCLDFIRKRR
jgi:regulator of sigma E protease